MAKRAPSDEELEALMKSHRRVYGALMTQQGFAVTFRAIAKAREERARQLEADLREIETQLRKRGKTPPLYRV